MTGFFISTIKKNTDEKMLCVIKYEFIYLHIQAKLYFTFKS